MRPFRCVGGGIRLLLQCIAASLIAAVVVGTVVGIFALMSFLGAVGIPALGFILVFGTLLGEFRKGPKPPQS